MSELVSDEAASLAAGAAEELVSRRLGAVEAQRRALKVANAS